MHNYKKKQRQEIYMNEDVTAQYRLYLKCVLDLRHAISKNPYLVKDLDTARQEAHKALLISMGCNHPESSKPCPHQNKQHKCIKIKLAEILEDDIDQAEPNND